ncbi:MAG: rhodanese-like domain-containing protein [Oscillospiraceae bacterium]|nr:rhodanese-like domain-containing protein [Oscillospiraceae bacterium]
MGLFQFFRHPNVNEGVAEYCNTPGAVLVDVRTPQEYREGHIPGSKNVPLRAIDKMTDIVENRAAVLYVYCYSGARSRQAVSRLQHMGYSNVNNIGGIADYHGKVERE